ncbi:kelch domain-containing protein 1-like [Sardina pilchardus]|uniref:kelch domain-containing protein 1-like n=1 Tax=Sardina pilchardus TaxID=27697 RepID=UPI002E0D4693
MDNSSKPRLSKLGLQKALGRSDHTAVVNGNNLYVWGGCQTVDGEEVTLPSDEMWVYDTESGLWALREMKGDIPPLLSQTCSSHLQDCLYVFGGFDGNGHTNQMYCVNLDDGEFVWKRMTDPEGTPPSPRDKHSCWVYRERIIYFGGYGCKTVREINNVKNFTVDHTSWATIGTVIFRFWGWNNEVHMFEPETNTWSEPQTQGVPPSPRASHASVTAGNKGYVCGGMDSTDMDLHCLDLDTWTWTQIYPTVGPLPVGRSLHTLTAVSEDKLFLFGGLSATGQPLSDAWEFDTRTREWRERDQQHRDQPRLWHSAGLGKDGDVVVFGGTREYTVLMDSVAVLRAPSQNHCSDVLVFQMQPYSLLRLCENCIGQNDTVLTEQVSWLPRKLKASILKRISYYSANTECQQKQTL